MYVCIYIYIYILYYIYIYIILYIYIYKNLPDSLGQPKSAGVMYLLGRPTG